MEENNIKLRTIFMGTSPLSEKILSTLISQGYNIIGVYTKIDKKVGREQIVQENSVKKLAKENNIQVFQPQKFNDDVIKELKELNPDLIIVAAYGKILPKAVLEAPGFGCINVHVSLLPKYRGPSPIQNAILNGDKETGTTIMLMDEGIDTGDVIAQEKIAIDDKDTTESLTLKLANHGAILLTKILPLWIEKKIEATPQNHDQATLCQLIERSDGRIFWEEEAEIIYNKYRALYPWPGVFTFWKTNESAAPLRLKLIEISIQKADTINEHASGQIFELGEKIGVQTLKGVIILETIQLEGKKATNVKEFANGYPSFIGSILM